MSNVPPPPPGFTLDQVEMSDMPPLPPGFTLDQPKPRKVKRNTASVPPPPDGFVLDQPTGEAVDGDTLRMADGPNLRLYGVDAPELRQPGWARDGTQIAIGQNARTALDTIATANARPGRLQGLSYGRPVAPVSDDGMDLGQAQLRSGNALAVPQYLARDPQRRFDYMQAERLARQNRLGVHDTFHQPPAEYRKAPMPTPDRETVAQFWDTPTPLAGMRPEAEQRYLELVNDRRVPAKTVQAFAAKQGFRVADGEVERVRAQSRKSGQLVGVGYRQAPRPLTDLGDGKTGAVLRGIGNGVLPNMLEEVGAAADTLGGTSGRENIWNSDRRLADIWFNNDQQNEAITGFDNFAHPYATLTGELAGSVILPVGGVRSAAGLAKWGGGYGFASGFGQDGSIPDRLTSGVIGAGLGVATTVLGTRALQAAAPHFGNAWRYLRGKAPEGAPADAAGLSEGITPPPEGFTVDASARAPDRIDIGQVPPPPAGFKLDDPRSIAMANDAGPAISSEVPRQRDYLFPDKPTAMSQPMSEAQMRAAAEGVMPGDVLPIPSNVVGSVEEAAAKDAGRIVPASAPHERGELTHRNVRAWYGASVPKVGPIDLVGWLRLNGGIKNQGNELTHMGLTNAARKDMDFVGQEARFGPLVSESGMYIDDAAMRAWEAGYFPDYTDRPTVHEFLDALRSTHEGRQRNYLAEDYPEIERFEGVRQERYDLEQERFETGQPLYRDKSYPGDDAAPFAPPSAFEEWPAGGPDFAGNINLGKLETPQDIARALDFTNRRVGFDAATRGRVAQAETERLAGELGMTPETLLSRRKGQALNAEEALAARQILAKSGNELVNAAKRVQGLDEPGDELLAEFRQKWMRHVAIQEQVSGMTAEAGRALGQFKMAANSRAIRGDVLSALVRGGGGTHNLKYAADVLLDAVELSPGRFNALAAKATKPKWSRRIGELYINFLLSNPATHVVNMTSNTLTAMAQIPEHAAAALIGKGREVFTRTATDRIIASEVGARIFGMVQGAKEGAHLFARAIKTGEPSDYVSKVEGEDYKAIPGLAGKAIRIPTRLLTAEDELFKGIARRMELNGLAARQAHTEGLRGEAAKQRIAQLSANPSDELLEQAMEYGRYLTFQRKLGPFAQSVSNASQQNLIAKLYLPFVRTPTNLLKFAAERSPAAPFMPSWRKDFVAGGARRDLAIAKMTVGTGFGIAIYQAALGGHITGAIPSDPKKARLLSAEGWQPYSIKIGDSYYSFKRLDPFAMTLGVAADLATLPEGMSERQRDDQATLLVASIIGNLASKTWLSGVSDLVEALSDPARNTGNMLERLVGSLLVPAGIAGVARAIDPTARQTDSVGEALMGRVPGLRDNLRPRRDIWGEVVKYDSGFLSPAYTSEAKSDPVNLELLKLDYSPGYASKKVGGAELTPQQHDAYQEQAGKLAHKRLTGLVAGAGWSALKPEDRAKAAKQVVDQARKEVRGKLFGGNKSEPLEDDGDQPAQSAPVGSSVPPPPPGFTLDGQSGGRNVFADLRLAIPGVRFTSGYRDKAYQADMRRRGYRPALGSRHLDGSSFDLLPPPGKSMGWLSGQVKRYDPRARVLPEGDHLHVTFPGYYGAPPLGGAKGAGLRNPNAGMPPPPTGFTLDAR